MDIRGQFTTEQVSHLLNAIKPTRVLRDGKGNTPTFRSRTLRPT